ncbi:filamentous hemagglutinin N-terminal domain-containing protein, partial [Pseudomonas sp. H3(2019)]|uniref:two-partner secretion domain-containing protein n=1 Tax=Pseudomonas sp. H3(2019) TaxID=2598724 RepID=UPI001192435A
MDVRQLAFLAGQPSAAVIPRERFMGMPKRGLAFLLANVMFWQPMWAQADGIVVSAPGTSLDRAGNGVPIVNIAAPNGSGLSHNQFRDYNVDTNGVILNNATARTQATQLGGIILGNPNLQGVSAQTILNEVNGGSPSRLNGYTEVAGQSARVIVANPYGISCNGCGFINTPRVTLTTGKPVLDNGRLDRFQVDQGSVSIDGAGINASNVDRFEIITRSAKINAQIQANNLTIVAGRNDVNADTLNATARANDGSTKPELAIDSSALGGMYAGAIKLVGTEAGVGVKLDGKLIASGGDIQLDANGQLSLAETSAVNGAVNIKANSLDARAPVYAGTALNVQTQGDLSNQQTLAARDSINLSAGGQLTNNGIIEAGVNADSSRNASGDVNLSAQNLNNSGKSVIASRNLTVNTAQTLTNQGGTFSAAQTANISAGTLDNQNKGRVLSTGTLSLTAGQVLNTQGVITSSGNLTANIGGLNNHSGEVSSASSTTLNATSLDNSDGQVTGDVALNIGLIGALNNQNGVLGSGKTVSISAASLDNSHAGRLVSDGNLTARITGVFYNQNGNLSANGVVDLQTGSLDNRNGSLMGKDRLTLQSASLDNRTGKVRADKDLQLNVGQLDNREQGLLNSQTAINFNGTHLDNRGGLLSAVGPVRLDAASVDNSGGRLSSGDSLSLTATQLTNQDGGRIASAAALTASVTGLNQQGGQLFSNTSLDLDLNHGQLNNQNGLINAPLLVLKNLKAVNNQGGEISSAQAFTVAADSLDNSNGKLLSNQSLTLRINQALASVKGMIAAAALDVRAASLDNSGGTLTSRASLELNLNGQLINQNQGLINATTHLNINSSGLNNQGGSLLGSAIAIDFAAATGDLNNSAGLITTAGTLSINHLRDLTNQGGEISSSQSINLSARALNNSSGSLVSNGAVTLDLLGALTNTNGKIASAGPLRVQRSTQINNQGGQLVSQGLMTLLTGGLDNRNRGTVAANDQLTLTATGTVQNSADGLIYSQNGGLQVQAASLSNAKGTLLSQGALNLTVGGDIDNQSGRILAKTGDLSISAGHLDNRGGVLASLQGAFTAHLTGVLKNGYDLNNNRQGGITQAQRLNLTALGGIDNYGGRISAQTGDAVIATGAGNFDNRNGGLYAKGQVNVTGNNFDNSGDNDGQIGGNQITLNLNGALNNRLGIIESDTTLAIKAASLDNQTGQLRALGTSGKTAFQIGGLFDNRNGTLESANTDLSLAVGGFLNGGGSLLHVGTGTFDISTANVTGAGGSIVTRGGLTLNADSWTNSSVIQAGRLNVNVNNFTQTASGQLLASDSFVGSGVNWFNDGLIASDGRLSLSLGGAYWGAGRLSSQGTLGLSAAQVSLNSVTSSIAGGSDTRLNVSGQLDNAGRLTSGAGMTVIAGGVRNFGTMGAGGDLTLTTGALLNSGGLIFSGGNMSLRVADLNNTNANVYSLGNLSIDRDGQGGLANSIVNSSASIQSDGSMNLAASTIQNIRSVLTTNDQGIYTARIGEIACIAGPKGNAGDCRGGKENHAWEIVQRDRFVVTAASAASSITAGGNLNINGGNLLNQSSTIATGGSLTATLANLANSGIETGETQTSRTFMSERTRDADGWYDAASAFTNKYWYQSSGYNANDLGGLQAGMSHFIGMTEIELPQFRKTEKLASSDQSYAAVIQAAGALKINAQSTIDNSVIRLGYTYVGSGARTDTGAAASPYSTRITLNQQLPPNLAQQQVNPLALPGFSLPTGQNGLFRLSGQGSSTPIASGPQSWTIGGASLAPTQRQQALPVGQVRETQLGSTTQPSTSGDNSSGTVLPGRSTAFTVNRVQGLPDSTVPSN